MSDLIYPTSAEIREIAQTKLPRLESDRPIFRHFPTVNSDAAVLVWEQRDNYTGLQQLRGLGGPPPRVARVGAKSYLMKPGVYGEHIALDETEMTLRRAYGTFGTPIDVSDLTMEAQDQLLERRLNRIEYIIWTLLAAGTFSVSSDSGVLHTDAYTTQTYTASPLWSDLDDSTPFANMRTVALKARGFSVNFGRGAELWMNGTTANDLFGNTNQLDVGGRRVPGGFTAANYDLQILNASFEGSGLPTIVIYDEGYYPDGGGAFTLYIPNGKAVLIGKRPAGQPVGEYRMLRNVNNPGMAGGPYMDVIDRGAEGSGRQIPRVIEVHDGHSGGPVIFYPSAIVLMTVG